MKKTNRKTTTMRILFNPHSSEYKIPFGCIKENQICHLSIDVPPTCDVQRLSAVITADDGFCMTLPMTFCEQRGDYKRYCTDFALFSRGLYFYYFKFELKESCFNLYKWGETDTNMGQGQKWQITCLPEDITYPNDFAGRVMYQIFPDRFAKNGDVDFTDKLTPYTVHYDKTEPPRKGPDENGLWNNDFYGGNFRGIEERLPYLKSLGVGVIYLNPIFKAYSNHRYDTCDYMKPDPMLGTEEDFSSLCRAAKALDIKVILDGVFSHTGDNSIYFDGWRKFGNGAVSNESSPYRDWYDFQVYPTEYTAWWGVKSLPCVNELADSYLDFIIRNEDSVIAHWLRLGANGFRLDVADELPDRFIYLLRKRVKEIDPHAIVIGEVWEDASNKWSYGVRRRYFSGGELDGVMNYPFKDLMIALVCHEISPYDFACGIRGIYENYPKEAMHLCMTFLSTHDTKRVRTVIEEKLGGGEEAKKALHCAFALQFFLPGMPSVYYGDECGMRGGKDPENRGWFTGETTEETELYRWLGSLRCSSLALRTGELKIDTENGILTVIRELGEERVALKVYPDNGFCVE